MPVNIETDFPRTRPYTEDRNFEGLYGHLYPEEVDLKPGSPTHEKIKTEILARAREAERKMSEKHSKWDKIDQTLSAFIPLDETERRIKAKDSRKPVSIVIPESYAVLETLLTYMMAAFGDPPTLRYEGSGPEDMLGAILLEGIVDTQFRKSKALLALHTQFRDAFAYGVGIAAVSWNVRMGKKSVQRPLGYASPYTGAFVETGVERVVEDSILYEGSKLDCVDPRRYLPDPSVEMHNVQAGEFVGWVDTDSYMGLLRDETSPGSNLFNVRYCRGRSMKSSLYRNTTEGIEKYVTTAQTQPIDVVYMYVDLIPKEWKLGSSETPEKWMFQLAGDEVIIAAAPLALHHNMFPVAVCCPDFGGHELMPVSRLEIMYGLQGVIDFYFNSHAAAVRRLDRNSVVFDPKSINSGDVVARRGYIRTRRPVWGRGVTESIMQLKQDDNTLNHMSDMAYAREIARTITGATDSLQGLQRSHGERVTKAEFQDTRASALSRLQKAARIISLQSMYDLATMYAYHTQQFMSQETYIKTSGRWEQTLRTEHGILDPQVRVSPFDIDVAFDVSIHDGSIEGAEFVDNWLMLWQTVASNPELTATFDVPRIFMHIARMMKAKNVQDFIRNGGGVQPTVMPDGQVAQQVAAGNMVPMEQAEGMMNGQA